MYTQSFIYFSKNGTSVKFLKFSNLKLFGKLQNLFSKVGGKLWRCEGYIDAKRNDWKQSYLT